jgi:hypothetical protein
MLYRDPLLPPLPSHHLHAHAHTRTRAHVHARARTNARKCRFVSSDSMCKGLILHGSSTMVVCVCACACICVCLCVCERVLGGLVPGFLQAGSAGGGKKKGGCC